MILGWDISGEIVKTGKNVRDFKAGDEVFWNDQYSGHGKAYAEYVAAPVNHIGSLNLRIFRTRKLPHPAWPPVTARTGHLRDHGKLKAGDRILIHAASGGVGHFAVQIAKYIGAYVIGSSSLANKEFVLNIDADQHLDYKIPDWKNRNRTS